jgi:hypothetical protein
MTPHKANPEHWQLLEEYAGIDCYSDACLLELRARIEALEADNQGCPHIATSTEGTSYCRLAEQTTISQPTPNPSPIRTSLVERVAATLHASTNSDPNVPANEWEPEARAAIREVAAWMTSNPDVYFPPALVFALEQEVER